MIGMLRSNPSTCAVAFGIPRLLSLPDTAGHSSFRAVRARATVSLPAASASAGRRRRLCVCAVDTRAAPQVDKIEKIVDKDIVVEEFEDSLDAMAIVCMDNDSDIDSSDSDTDEDDKPRARLR